MKRLLVALYLCGALSICHSLSAQSSSASRFTLSAGVGLLPTYFKSGEGSGMPPVSFKFGVDVTKKFALSTIFGYSNTTAKSSGFAEANNSYLTNKTMVFGIRGELKKELSNRMSVYAGSMVGYTYADVKEYNQSSKALVIRAAGTPTPFNPDEKNGKVTYSAFIGTNLNLTKRVNLYGELGYGISILNLGVTVRI